MTNKRSDRDALASLTAALVEDILTSSDAEIIAETRQDKEALGDAVAATRDQFEKAISIASKGRLTAARLAVANDRWTPSGGHPANPIKARRRLERILAHDPSLTLAARKGQGFSDEDVQGMLEDLEDLGIDPAQDES